MTEKKSVLVVDDDESMLEFCSAVLALEGFEVTPVSNGADALAQISSRTFSMVVTDHVLVDSRRSVLEAARSLRPEAPVIVISGTATFAAEVLAYLAGARGYLAKPFTLDQLKGAINSCLKPA